MKKTQKSPRLQHYVPQLLLRRFAGADGKLWAYDTENGKAFASQRKNLAAEGYFYGGTTDGDLIIGDHPVTLTDVAPHRTAKAPLGVKNPNIEIVMPLSPRLAAAAHWDGPTGYRQLAPGMADMLNERTMRNAHRFVFAGFESKELLEKAISLRGTGPKMRNYKVKIGEKLVMWNEFS